MTTKKLMEDIRSNNPFVWTTLEIAGERLAWFILQTILENEEKDEKIKDYYIECLNQDRNYWITYMIDSFLSADKLEVLTQSEYMALRQDLDRLLKQLMRKKVK